MKNVIIASTLGLMVMGCSNANPLKAYGSSWWAQKDQCAAGNYETCADIAHQAHPQPAAPEYNISEPIID